MSTRDFVPQWRQFLSYKVWDKRNRLVESRTASNALLGQYFYNERGLRVKAVRAPQPEVRVVAPNGGESLFLGATNMISWSGAGLAGALVSLELLADGAVAGTIAANLPGTRTSCEGLIGDKWEINNDGGKA